jgi:hypothetical protein
LETISKEKAGKQYKFNALPNQENETSKNFLQLNQTAQTFDTDKARLSFEDIPLC